MSIRNQLSDSDLEKQIKAIVAKFGSHLGVLLELSVDVERNDSSQVLVEIVNMYEQPCECGEELLGLIRDLVGADHSECYESIEIGGCETCDFGSRYGFAVRCW